MKPIITLLVACVTASLCFSQTYFVLPGHCKKKDVEIITGETIPVGYVVTRFSTFNKSEVEGTIEGLTKKQIGTMKTHASWSKSCTVFIAFNEIQTHKGFTPGAEYYEDKVCFYVLDRFVELEMK